MDCLHPFRTAFQSTELDRFPICRERNLLDHYTNVVLRPGRLLAKRALFQLGWPKASCTCSARLCCTEHEPAKVCVYVSVCVCVCIATWQGQFRRTSKQTHGSLQGQPGGCCWLGTHFHKIHEASVHSSLPEMAHLGCGVPGLVRSDRSRRLHWPASSVQLGGPCRGS